MPRKSDGCFHCDGKLALYEGPSLTKQGRVECDTCRCSFRFDALETRGAGCSYSPSEAIATPTVASE